MVEFNLYDTYGLLGLLIFNRRGFTVWNFFIFWWRRNLSSIFYFYRCTRTDFTKSLWFLNVSESLCLETLVTWRRPHPSSLVLPTIWSRSLPWNCSYKSWEFGAMPILKSLQSLLHPAVQPSNNKQLMKPIETRPLVQSRTTHPHSSGRTWWTWTIPTLLGNNSTPTMGLLVLPVFLLSLNVLHGWLYKETRTLLLPLDRCSPWLDTWPLTA